MTIVFAGESPEVQPSCRRFTAPMSGRAAGAGATRAGRVGRRRSTDSRGLRMPQSDLPGARDDGGALRDCHHGRASRTAPG